MRCTAVFGGVGKYEQFKELKAGVEVLVATPGRLIELIGTKGALSMARVTYVVIDEADRMFSLGFEQQVRSIVGQVRPGRQTLLFSATFKPNLERLARDVLTEPVRVTVGEAGDANEDVTQVVEVLATEALKWGWLIGRLAHFLQQGTVQHGPSAHPWQRPSSPPAPPHHGQSARLGSERPPALARPLCLRSARLVALCSSALPG